MPVHSSFRFARCQDGTTSLNTQHLTYQAYHPANAPSNALKRTELYEHQAAIRPIEWTARGPKIEEKSELCDPTGPLLNSDHK
jgi:hypothetical protein